MGGWDCYCALCCAPLVAGSIRVGDTSEEALKERRERKVNKTARRRMIDSYEEEHSYDPDMIQPQDMEWLNSCRALGFNPNARGITKAYLSGPGQPEEYGSFGIEKYGDDPNDPGEDQMDMYHTLNGDALRGFPFHEVCYDILTKNLGYKDKQEIDKDALFSTMDGHFEAYGSSLILDYGADHGAEQYWDCISGCEYVVTNPSPKSEFQATLQSLMPAKLFADSPASPDLSHKVRNDPLSILPYDVVFEITKHLRIDEVLKLTQASWHVFNLTRQSTFWTQMTYMHILPWFYEWADMLKSITLPTSFNPKNTFFWLDHVTKVKFGMEGPLMGIANRRRIWEVCDQLAVNYNRICGIEESSIPDGEEAKNILRTAVCLDMPIVIHPEPRTGRTISAQFIDSWSELEYRSCRLDTYWSLHQTLTGIELSFDDTKRLFGVAQGEKGQTVEMAPGEWIQEIVVGTQMVDVLDKRASQKQHQGCAIKHMEVVLTSGRHVVLQSYEHDNLRGFVVLPGMHLVGLTGQVAPNGFISRFGLLQAAREGEEPASRPFYTAMQKALYSKKTTQDSLEVFKQPPWRRNDVRIYQSDFFGVTGVASDMQCYELFQWAHNPNDCKRLTSITCFQPIGGQALIGNETFDIPQIVGLKSEYASEQSEQRTVGTGGPVPAQAKKWHIANTPAELNLSEQFEPWDNDSSVRFDIDGPGGEVVTEVHVSTDGKAIKLRTNRQRECFFGEERRSHWRIKQAEPGEMIMGLSVCFGSQGGWNWSAKMNSHWAMSGVGALFMTVGSEGE